MTREDVLALKPGDCVVGFAGAWEDEHRVLEVHPPRSMRDKRVQRSIVVAYGRAELRGHVSEGEEEIRIPKL